MGLYDGYQLENSKLGRQYVGNTINEVMKVSEVMQGRYDQSQLGMEGIGAMMRNAKALEKDKELLASRMKEYDNQLKSWAQREDLENINVDVAKGARRFTEEYKNFADNLQRASAWREELDKAVNEGKISKSSADDLYQRDMYMYQGMQYDPTTGRYEGQFNNRGFAKEVDATAKLKGILGDMAAQKGGTLVESPNGDYFIKQGNKYERITQDRIDSAVQSALTLDKEWQADIAQRADLRGFKAAASGLRLKDLEGAKDAQATMLASAVKEKMESGMSERDAIYSTFREAEGKNIEKSIRSLSNKYAYDNRWTEFEYDGRTIEGEKKVTEQTHTPWVVPDNADRLVPKTADLVDIKRTIGNVNTGIAAIDKKLENASTLPADEVRELKRQRQELISQKVANEGILKNAGDAVAKEMGYDSQEDMEKKLAEKASRTIGTPGRPTVGGSYFGKKITAINGTDSYMGREMYNVTLSDGSKVKIPYDKNAKGAANFIADFKNSKEYKDFEKRREHEIKTRAQNYAVTPTVMSIPDKYREELKIVLQGSSNSMQWFKPGSTEPIERGSIPADFDINSIQLVKQGGAVFLKASGLSTEKGKVGQRTGDEFKVRIEPGSNVGRKIAQYLLLNKKGNPNMDADAINGARVLLGDWSGTLMSMQDREEWPIIGNDGQTLGKVRRDPYENNPTASRYRVFLADGKEMLVDNEDDRRDPAKLGNIIEEVIAKAGSSGK